MSKTIQKQVYSGIGTQKEIVRIYNKIESANWNRTIATMREVRGKDEKGNLIYEFLIFYEVDTTKITVEEKGSGMPPKTPPLTNKDLEMDEEKVEVVKGEELLEEDLKAKEEIDAEEALEVD